MTKFQKQSSEFVLKPSEVRAIAYGITNPRDTALILLLAYTGLRRMEAQQLDVQDIGLRKEEEFINVRSGKGDKQRIVPLNPQQIPEHAELINRLNGIIGNRQKGILFQSNKGGRLSLVQINRIIARAGEKAGIKNPNPKMQHINVHLFRHFYARYLKDKGVSLETVSDLLGHSDINVTAKMYGTKSIDDIRKELGEKLRSREEGKVYG